MLFCSQSVNDDRIFRNQAASQPKRALLAHWTQMPIQTLPPSEDVRACFRKLPAVFVLSPQVKSIHCQIVITEAKAFFNLTSNQKHTHSPQYSISAFRTFCNGGDVSLSVSARLELRGGAEKTVTQGWFGEEKILTKLKNNLQ